MKFFDRWFEQSSRAVARRVSRRHLLARVGGVLMGGAALPLLPVELPVNRPNSCIRLPARPVMTVARPVHQNSETRVPGRSGLPRDWML